MTQPRCIIIIKLCMWCFVLINSLLLNILCVWIYAITGSLWEEHNQQIFQQADYFIQILQQKKHTHTHTHTKKAKERLSKEIVHWKKRKEERLVLKCFMQIKITEHTKVVYVYSIPGAHQTKPFLVSAAVCSHFFPSFHRSLLGKPLLLFSPPVFWTSCFLLHNPDQSSTLTSLAV